MRVLLIDDEEIALEVLEIMISKIEGIEIVGKYTNPLLALQELLKVQVDVVFLDMEMPEIHGIEFAEKVMERYNGVEVLFVTAHPQFALEAFEVNATDYLLKPVSMTRLTKAVNKVEERIALYKSRNGPFEQTQQVLYARFMSNFTLLDYQQKEVKWRTRKVKELFIFLWHNRENLIHKANVVEALWPEMEATKAVTLLHTTVYQLRKALKDIGVENSITLVNDHYKLSVPLTSDVLELKEIVQTKDTHPLKVERALELYSGDYLEGDVYPWSIQYQQWVKQAVLLFLEKFITISENKVGQNALVEKCLEKMLILDMYNETIMHQLMKHYQQSNNTQKIKALYGTITNNLVDELGVKIPREIVDLYNECFSH
ncbi:response regulator [Viridibacillus sp. YIM B01967]|uniref:Response regulator n=1 Tax=Viridibacillus soli TaxID=2798301 RepID=A0ABS1H8V0_9BACL|nr:response regulator [Viridibacillus soli]MBK3495847.1 response regulator [Viridibacillus soli]